MSESEVWRAIEELRRRQNSIATIELPRRASAFAARYSSAVAQQFANSTTIIVDYATPSYDTGARVTTGVSWRYTCASAGIYSVKASILFASTNQWNLGEAGSLNLYKNGANYSSLDRNGSTESSVTAQFMRLKGADDILLAVGDFIDIRLAQVSAAAAGFLALHTDPTFNYVAIAKIP